MALLSKMIAAVVLLATPISPVRPAEERCAAGCASIGSYVEPYVATNNFSGVLLVARDGQPVLSRVFGFADLKAKKPNASETRFHVASMSMLFTASAALRLVMARKLALDTPVSQVIPDYPNGAKITVRHLLTQTSGIANINDLPDYDSLLQDHQTPEVLVAKVRDLPPKRSPGTYEREEHSAYNLLALIIERRSGLAFAKAVERLVFRPAGMVNSGIDDDGAAAMAGAARGYAPVGITGIEPARAIHWSAKAGSGSAYTTAGDLAKFVSALNRDTFLAPTLRTEMFDLSSRVGFGWFKSNSRRFGQPVYSMNGRAPGFASAMVYVPREKLLIVALSNIYSSVPTDIAYDTTAIMLGLPHQSLDLRTSAEAGSLAALPAEFRFPADFYQPNALVRIEREGDNAILRWPQGPPSALIAIGLNRFIDRSYWVPVELVRSPDGMPIQLKYDRFVGQREDGTKG